MRNVVACFIAFLLLAVSPSSGGGSGRHFDWNQWRYLPVLDDGRHKPLDTLARETLRMVYSCSRLADPESGETLEPVAAYLSMLFEWQGWDKSSGPHGMLAMGPAAYFLVHQPDKWDRTALLRVDSRALRQALGMPDEQKWISPWELSRAKIRDPHTGKPAPLLTWTRNLYRTKQQGFTKFEEEALKLADKLFSYQSHRMGDRLYVLPIQGSEHQDWISLSALMQSDWNDKTDPTGALRKAKEQFQAVRAAYLAGSPEAFDRAAAALLATARQTGPQLGVYPSREIIGLEVAYNRWAPFRLAWVFIGIAFLCLLASSIIRRRILQLAGLTALGCGLLAMIAGFAARVIISGRAPVTNLYESVVFAAFGAVVFGLILAVVYRKSYVLAAACAVATVALMLADFCPGVLNPSIRPLMPVLRSNFWLAVHVITIMLSYAAFALALAIGNITVGYYLVGSQNREAIAAQNRFTYKSLKAGILLLTVGTILGAMWADYSWGRFWGWDRKEVWALITLLGYLALVHARSAKWVGNLGLAAWSVVCFALVVMAWYGVNLMGKGGLHNYALGHGPAYYVLGAVLVQLLYVGAAVARYTLGTSRLAAT